MNRTLDTTALIRGLVPPRRRKQDEILEERKRIHKIASHIVDQIYEGKYRLFIPTVALAEVAAVTSRLTDDAEFARRNVRFVRSLSYRILSESIIIDEAISIGIDTKISGFDSLFIAGAKYTNSILITDDSRMHKAALEVGIHSKLLREMSV